MNSVINQQISSVRNNMLEVYNIDYTRYARLYKCKYAAIRRAGLRIFNNSFVIENIVQDAFLKLWKFRDTITSDDHARAFLLLQVKWDCYRHFGNSGSRFHRELKLLDDLPNYDAVYGIIEPEPYDHDEDELVGSRLRSVTDMIGLLSEGRMKNMLKAHYQDGLGHKQIAERYDISVAAVTQEIQKAVALLKNMIVKPGEVLGNGNSVSVCDKVSGNLIHLHEAGNLTRQQSRIYHLRSDEKYSFERIAVYLCIPVSEVQKEYVMAWKVVSWLKKEKDKKVKATAKRRVNTFGSPASAAFVPVLRTA